jgi:hypothetical protein
VRCWNRCRCKSSSRIPASPLCCIVVRVSRKFVIFSHRCIVIVIVSKRNGRTSRKRFVVAAVAPLVPIRLGQYRHHDRWFAVRANAFFRSATVNSPSIVPLSQQVSPRPSGTGALPIVISVVVFLFCVTYSTGTVRDSRDIRLSHIPKYSIVSLIKYIIQYKAVPYSTALVEYPPAPAPGQRTVHWVHVLVPCTKRRIHTCNLQKPTNIPSPTPGHASTSVQSVIPYKYLRVLY